ncbi:MAG: ATP-binding cassette domain-containing protein [Lachnospiraceae bacterium]|nr:ATP-binding cassette domain-containing protein [Lachnospiraceae bacterium]
MSKTVLKIRDLNIKSELRSGLSHVSLHLTQGHVSGLLGPNGGGKDTLVHVISGRIQPDYYQNHIYLEGKRLLNDSSRAECVYYIQTRKLRNKSLDNWTVAEYIAMRNAPFLMIGSKVRLLKEQIQKELDEWGIILDAGTRLKHLNELQRRQVELVKALHSGMKVLILEDECETLDDQELVEYAAFVRTVAEKGLAILFYSHNEALTLDMLRRTEKEKA